ncbi:hypothetical protein MCHI_001342 [Candidatus Magnetoovum chiemensis]|nr:hypothetical protein MCHI_001342 [Candidatus Magnetoovum chiemensis]
MPKAYINLLSVMVRDLSIELIIFSADLFPILSIEASAALSREKISEKDLTNPFSTNLSTIFLPRPSMSKAFLDTKCFIRSFNWAVHEILIHLVAASSSNRFTGLRHTGQSRGIENFSSIPVLFDSTTFTIFGITSPARTTTTVSPILTSLRKISSSLCKVARETVTPPTFTGSRTATGVSMPVLPTCTTISFTFVAASNA